MAEAVTPSMIANITSPIILGRLWIPDCSALSPLTAWNQIGSCYDVSYDVCEQQADDTQHK